MFRTFWCDWQGWIKWFDIWRRSKLLCTSQSKERVRRERESERSYSDESCLQTQAKSRTCGLRLVATLFVELTVRRYANLWKRFCRLVHSASLINTDEPACGEMKCLLIFLRFRWSSHLNSGYTADREAIADRNVFQLLFYRLRMLFICYIQFSYSHSFSLVDKPNQVW